MMLRFLFPTFPARYHLLIFPRAHSDLSSENPREISEIIHPNACRHLRDRHLCRIKVLNRRTNSGVMNVIGHTHLGLFAELPGKERRIFVKFFCQHSKGQYL